MQPNYQYTLASLKWGNQKGNEDKKATEVFQGQVHFYKNYKIINKPFLMSNQMWKSSNLVLNDIYGVLKLSLELKKSVCDLWRFWSKFSSLELENAKMSSPHCQPRTTRSRFSRVIRCDWWTNQSDWEPLTRFPSAVIGRPIRELEIELVLKTNESVRFGSSY